MIISSLIPTAWANWMVSTNASSITVLVSVEKKIQCLNIPHGGESCYWFARRVPLIVGFDKLFVLTENECFTSAQSGKSPVVNLTGASKNDKIEKDMVQKKKSESEADISLIKSELIIYESFTASLSSAIPSCLEW